MQVMCCACVVTHSRGRHTILHTHSPAASTIPENAERILQCSNRPRLPRTRPLGFESLVMVELRIRTLVSIVGVSLGLGLFLGRSTSTNARFERLQLRRQLIGLDEFSDPKSIVGKTTYHDGVTMGPPLHVDDTTSLLVGDAPYIAHVSTMCRCPSGQLPRPIFPDGNPFLGSANNRGGSDVGLYQWPSKATGPAAKMFSHHPIEECICNKDRKRTQKTTDMYLKSISNDWFVSRRCPQYKGTYDWLRMPDLAVEKLPLFVGVLSYER